MRLKRKGLENSLQDCLESIEDGRESIEASLPSHPDSAGTLRPELEAAAWLRGRQGAFDPRPGFIEASRRRLLAAIQGGPASDRHLLGLKFDPLSLFARRTSYARLLLGLLLVAVSLFSAGRLGRASHTWLPGDLFYPLKVLSERAELLSATAAAGQAQLHTQFAQQRLMEVQALVLENRYEQIPSTVVNFAVHVEQALRAIDRVAEHDQGQASALAVDLRDVLSNQSGLVSVLAGFAPSGTQSEFELVRLVSESGISALRHLLMLETGGVFFPDG